MNRYSAPAFLATTKVLGASFSHDEESVLISSDKSGVFNVYTLSILDSTSKQRTFSSENTFAISYFPDSEAILFLREQRNDETVHLYVLDINSIETDLTPGDGATIRFYGWSKDERSFFYTSHERDNEWVDLYRMNAETLERMLVYRISSDFDLAGISPDQNFLALRKVHSSQHSSLCICSLASRQVRNISGKHGEAHVRYASFDPSCRYLYYLTDLDSEFTYLERYDLYTEKYEPVQKASCDITYALFSRDGGYRITGFGDLTGTRVEIREQATKELISLPELPKAGITGVTVSPSGRLIGFYVDGDCAPNDLHVLDLTSKRITRLTNSLNHEIDSSDLVESKVVQYKSFDGLEIPSLLWVPHSASSKNKLPGLVWIHGGPGDQISKGYHGLIQFLINHDYAVLAVNHRGSRGFGKTFRRADDRKHGREPLWDCIEGRKYLASIDFIEPSKIGIIGESYGGYMVLAALAFHPEEFSVGVDMFGVSNWLQMLEKLPTQSKSMADFLYAKIGNPKTDAEMLRRISPVFQADHINKPLLVLQGARDLAVAKEQSDQLVNAIKRNHGVVEYLVFDDEGHGFSKKHNQLTAYESILKFLDHYLKDSAGALSTGELGFYNAAH